MDMMTLLGISVLLTGLQFLDDLSPHSRGQSSALFSHELRNGLSVPFDQ